MDTFKKFDRALDFRKSLAKRLVTRAHRTGKDLARMRK